MNRQVRKQRVGLEHHVHGALVGGHPGDVLAIKQDRAMRGRFEAGQHPHQGCLATARRAQQCEKFLWIDVEGKVINSSKRAKPFCYRLKLDQGHCLGVVPRFKNLVLYCTIHDCPTALKTRAQDVGRGPAFFLSGAGLYLGPKPGHHALGFRVVRSGCVEVLECFLIRINCRIVDHVFDQILLRSLVAVGVVNIV